MYTVSRKKNAWRKGSRERNDEEKEKKNRGEGKRGEAFAAASTRRRRYTASSAVKHGGKIALVSSARMKRRQINLYKRRNVIVR